MNLGKNSQMEFDLFNPSCLWGKLLFAETVHVS